MSDWIDIAAAADMAPGSHRTADVEGTAIAVFNVDGTYYAIEDLCSHAAATLSQGRVEGCEIVCPRHGARFSLISGAALSPPAWEPIATLRVRVVDGRVQVRDDRCSE